MTLYPNALFKSFDLDDNSLGNKLIPFELQESSKSIQIEAFHVFKLFVANQNKPAEIVNILVTNRSKLLRLLADLRPDKEDERFEADKSHVLREISSLEPLVLA
ncbi:hypothetical protein F2Q68_00020308 [Brassica cretica]|uniref:MO25-like protein n=1 Tax=Brassica cretica TaxID=69181 RepID=A0A8S9FUT9_BRACR|nr:hypothetical protein F2Q68_00020308 [Brassica cretica]